LIREISFEIDMLWQYGLDVNDTQLSPVLRLMGVSDVDGTE